VISRRQTKLFLPPRPCNLTFVHGHGAKGGAYARLAASRLGANLSILHTAACFTTSWASAQGFAFLTAEKLLLRKTSGLVFVCDYERKAFDGKVGLGQHSQYVVAHNGLWDEEFQPVALEPDCTDILFVGELRALKGVDELLDALAILNRDMPVRATITGAGPDDAALFQARAERPWA
jgi:glycosyltransferase involved in cell wall biosynthesis